MGTRREVIILPALFVSKSLNFVISFPLKHTLFLDSATYWTKRLPVNQSQSHENNIARL